MAVSSRIFISYRRDDSPAYAGRLFDQLSARFGAAQVFMDVDTLEPGVDFIERIEESVGSADVLIAVIGRGWASAVDKNGRRRLDDPHDFVRLEVGGALRRNIRVIPVLVAGAKMPSAEELPADLDGLVRRNGLEISDTEWRSGTERLFVTIEHVLSLAAADPPPPSVAEPAESPAARASGARRSRRPLWVIAGVGAVLAVGLGTAAVLGMRDDGGESPAETPAASRGSAPAVSGKSAPATTRTISLVPYLVGPLPNDPSPQGRCFVPFTPEAAVRVRGAVLRSDWIQCGDFPGGGDPNRATGTYRFAGLTLPPGSRLAGFRGLGIIDEFSASSQRGSRVTWTVLYGNKVLCADTVAWTAPLPTPTMFSCDTRDTPGDFDVSQLRIQQRASLASAGDFWAGFLHPKVVVTAQD